MKKFRVIKWALKSIARNPTRTFLTTLGIVIGIAAVIAVIEIGNGAQVSLENNFAEMGVNTIRVWPGPVTRSGINSGSGSWATLTVADTRAIMKDCPTVVAISPQLSVRGQLIYGNKNWRPFNISGGNEQLAEITSWKIQDGEPISEMHVARASKVCLVGQTIVRELFDGQNPVGKDLRIQNVVFKVIGVLKSRGANMMGMDMDDCVIMPWTTMKSRLKGAGQTSLSAAGTTTDTSTSSTTSASDIYTSGVSLYPKAYNTIPPVRFANIDSMIMSVAHPDDVSETIEKVSAILRDTHKLGDADDDFRIRSMAEFAETLKKQTESVTKLLMCVAFVSLLVGGVGIMNIMLVSVTERTREIGLRMAVGARAGDILRQFLVESIVICIFGGIIGIALGHGLSMFMAAKMGWSTAISYYAICLSVGVSALVGVLFGYYPAWKAARLDPIEALRYE